MVLPRTPHNRGFSNQRARRLVNPSVARPYAGGRTLPGAPTLGKRQTVVPNLPYPQPPSWWMASLGEWIVYWWLTEVKKYQEGKDFYYQAPVFAPFLFSSRDFTRVDFLLDYGPQSAVPPIGRYRALALDPITAFTHPDPNFDRDRRNELEAAGYLLIFLETDHLRTRPKEVLEAALRGRDESSRGSSQLASRS